MPIFEKFNKITKEYIVVNDKNDNILNGMAKKKNFTEEDADPKELKMGIEIEMEHTDNPDIAKIIALDHLSENPNSPLGYYTGLKILEKIIEKINNSKPSISKKIINILKNIIK